MRFPGFIPLTLAALVVTIGGFWGYSTGMVDMDTARLVKTHAKLHDANCVFTAAFHLESAMDQAAFAMHQTEIRDQIVDAMRFKSRYMMESPSARKGLSLQLANMVNRIAGKPIAKSVSFEQFDFM